MAYEEPINQGAPGPAPSEPGESPMDNVGAVVEEHPELLVGAAFVGGFALAKILKLVGE
jgi:hypothetical protein